MPKLNPYASLIADYLANARRVRLMRKGKLIGYRYVPTYNVLAKRAADQAADAYMRLVA